MAGFRFTALAVLAAALASPVVSEVSIDTAGGAAVSAGLPTPDTHAAPISPHAFAEEERRRGRLNGDLPGAEDPSVVQEAAEEIPTESFAEISRRRRSLGSQQQQQQQQEEQQHQGSEPSTSFVERRRRSTTGQQEQIEPDPFIEAERSRRTRSGAAAETAATSGEGSFTETERRRMHTSTAVETPGDLKAPFAFAEAGGTMTHSGAAIEEAVLSSTETEERSRRPRTAAVDPEIGSAADEGIATATPAAALVERRRGARNLTTQEETAVPSLQEVDARSN